MIKDILLVLATIAMIVVAAALVSQPTPNIAISYNQIQTDNCEEFPQPQAAPTNQPTAPSAVGEEDAIASAGRSIFVEKAGLDNSQAIAAAGSAVR